MTRKYVGLILGLVVFFAVLFFTDLEPGKPEVTRTLAVALLMAIWWVSEAIPLAVTALIPLVLFPFLGVIDGKEVYFMQHPCSWGQAWTAKQWLSFMTFYNTDPQITSDDNMPESVKIWPESSWKK